MQETVSQIFFLGPSFDLIKKNGNIFVNFF